MIFKSGCVVLPYALRATRVPIAVSPVLPDSALCTGWPSAERVWATQTEALAQQVKLWTLPGRTPMDVFQPGAHGTTGSSLSLTCADETVGVGKGEHSYIIQGGRKGSDRLIILANATWPTSKSFLLRAGLKPGMNCLDVGCGNGEISMRLFEIIGETGPVLGVDMDPTKIAIAKEKAAEARHHFASFDVLNLETEDIDPRSTFDFIYVRLVFSHLKDPAGLLDTLRQHLNPQGIVAVEDVYFDGHYCVPACPAFERYVALYKAAARQRGADANIGPKLEAMIRAAGYHNVQAAAITPVFTEGDGKLMALVTMEAISEAVVKAGLATQEDVDGILRDLAEYSRDPHTTMSIPTFHQIHFGL